MEKSLEQIQKENRKFILEAIHGCSYEEALEKDEKSLSSNSFFSNGLCLIREYIRPENFYKGLGQPLTLSRVLLALDKLTLSGHLFDIFAKNLYKIEYGKFTKICKIWDDYEKETLEEQTEETQRGLNKFFND